MPNVMVSLLNIGGAVTVTELNNQQLTHLRFAM